LRSSEQLLISPKLFEKFREFLDLARDAEFDTYPRRPTIPSHPPWKHIENDFRDGEAIAEAVQRPTMKFVATKT
jgi:hypothetical protein